MIIISARDKTLKAEGILMDQGDDEMTKLHKLKQKHKNNRRNSNSIAA